MTVLTKIPSAKEQRELVKALHTEHGILKSAGERVYVLSSAWYYEWEDYTTNKRKQPPGEIENQKLIEQNNGDPNYQLKRDLIQSFDYIVINEPIWVALRQWYGGGPAIARKTIRDGDGRIEAEVYPYVVAVSIVDLEYGDWSFTYEREILLSKTKTVAELFSKLLSMFEPVYQQELDLGATEYRLQVSTMGDIFKVVDFDDSQLATTTLEKTGWKQSEYHVFRVMLEAKEKAGWPTERAQRAPVEKIEFAPSGGYSGGRIDSSATTSAQKGDLSSLAKYFNRGFQEPTVNSGDKVAPVLPGVCGLQNIGNTCYMNSSLQALARCKPLVRYFTSNGFVKDISTKSPNPLVFHFAAVMQMIHGGEHSVVTPGQFKSELGKMNRFFKGFRQHDAEEFVSFVLGRLSDETNRTNKEEESNPKKQRTTAPQNNRNAQPTVVSVEGDDTKEAKLVRAAFDARARHRKTADSFVLDVFEGQYASQVKCKTCESSSTTFDPFLVLSLAIPEIAQASKSVISLEDCFVNFATEEALSGTDKWYCSTCNELRPATKKLSLLADFMPQILVVQLKRFSALGVKVNEAVQIAETLDLSRLVVPSTSTQRKNLKYNLFSITQHMGVTGGGHYTAQSKCEDGKWRLFNDSSIRDEDPDLNESTAYILYYERASVNSS